MKRSSYGKPPVLRDQVISSLSQVKEATAIDLGVSGPFLATLVNGGYVRRAGSVKVCEAQGRPRTTFRLTRKGSGRARTLARQSA